MSFNQQLTALRKARGISQEALADMLGVSRQAVSKWETAETQPEMANLLALCEILQVSPNQLMGWKETAEEKTVAEPAPAEPRKKSKFVVAIAAICMCAALAAGIFIGSSLDVFDKPAEPLAGIDRVGVMSFDYSFTGAIGLGNLQLTFMPTIIDENLTYEVVRIDERGNTQSYAAKYAEGMFIAYVDTVAYEWVTYSLKVSDGENVLSCPLFKVHDNSDYSYTHEELWQN